MHAEAVDEKAPQKTAANRQQCWHHRTEAKKVDTKHQLTCSALLNRAEESASLLCQVLDKLLGLRVNRHDERN